MITIKTRFCTKLKSENAIEFLEFRAIRGRLYRIYQRYDNKRKYKIAEKL